MCIWAFKALSLVTFVTMESSTLFEFQETLSFASFFGLYAGYFDSNGQLRARNRWAYYLRSLIFQVIIFVGLFIGIWYFTTQGPDGKVFTFGDYFTWYLATNKRFLDKVTFVMPPMGGVLSSFIVMFMSGVSIKDEIELEEAFREQLPKTRRKRLMPIYRNIFV